MQVAATDINQAEEEKEIDLSLFDGHQSISRMGSMLSGTSATSVTAGSNSPSPGTWESSRRLSFAGRGSGGGGDDSAAAAADARRPAEASRGAEEGSIRVSLSPDCLLQVSVASACERYLRVWLERSPPAALSGALPLNSPSEVSPQGVAGIRKSTTDASSSGIAIGGEAVVLQPGDAAPLACFVLPTAAVSLGLQPSPSLPSSSAPAPPISQLTMSNSLRQQTSNGPLPMAAPSQSLDNGNNLQQSRSLLQQQVHHLPEEPNRLAAAEAICETLSIAWRMIGLEDDAPHGSVQLSAVDVARVRLNATSKKPVFKDSLNDMPVGLCRMPRGCLKLYFFPCNFPPIAGYP